MRAVFSKPWTVSRKIFQALEKSAPKFPSLGNLARRRRPQVAATAAARPAPPELQDVQNHASRRKEVDRKMGDRKKREAEQRRREGAKKPARFPCCGGLCPPWAVNDSPVGKGMSQPCSAFLCLQKLLRILPSSLSSCSGGLCPPTARIARRYSSGQEMEGHALSWPPTPPEDRAIMSERSGRPSGHDFATIPSAQQQTSDRCPLTSDL